MTGIIFILIAGLFLAFSNGANDNFKGVATLFGSGTTSYKTALIWATLTTFAGSIVAFFLAQKLMANFSGKGLVPDSIVMLKSFSCSVALASAMTVYLATRLGFPISTTHAITGALVGTGLIASPSGVNFSKLSSAFFMPLLISPFLAILATIVLYPMFKFAKNKFRVKKESCLCIGSQVIQVAPFGFPAGAASAVLDIATTSPFPQVSIGTNVTCEERYVGEVWGVSAKNILDNLHFLTAGMVSFARGLNDTPKIATILLVGGVFSPANSIALVAIVMALGGILYAKKIAETMAHQITEMNEGQGFTANLVTSVIAIGASKLGMPVSTTHVSCGALFGIGTVTQKGNLKSISKIIGSWFITLPMAALLGYLNFLLLREIF